jgi:hypothetical protein
MLFSLAMAGCGREEAIHSYRVPKQDVVFELNHLEGASKPAAATTASRPERTLAATVLHQQDGWFFKLSGPPEQVAGQVKSFDKFVRSLNFETGKPTWKLPADWKQLPGREMRFATIEVDAGGEKPLELSVISLPRGETEEQEYLLANVNRWRGQLALPTIEAAELDEELEKIEVPGAVAYVIDIEGTASGAGMGRGPFAGGGAGSAAVPARPQAAGDGGAEVKYDLPEGWQVGKPVMFSKASFTVTDGQQQVQTTISDLAAAAGDLLPNINRWRGQVGLPNQSQAELEAELKTLPVAGQQGHYVVLEGPGKESKPQTILGVIVQHSGKAWFIKLMGDAPLAAREQQRFEAFVKSLKFGSEGSGSDGN